MNDSLIVCTEASDSQFHLTRTLLNSFVQANPKFTGKFYLLVHSSQSLSTKNFELLKLFYEQIEVKTFDSHPIFKVIEKYLGKSQYLELVNAALKWAALESLEENQSLLYLANYCLVQGDVSALTSNSLIKTNKTLAVLYSSEKLSIPESAYSLLNKYTLVQGSFIDDFIIREIPMSSNWVEYPPHLVQFTSNFPNSNFTVKKGQLNSTPVIAFNTLGGAITYSKVNQLWLFANNQGGQFLQNPLHFRKSIAPQLLTNSREVSAKHNTQPLAGIKNTLPRLARFGNVVPVNVLYPHLNRKKIAIVANSSELLNYEYGELIDSHDIVIRFNGFVISKKHTGSKTDLHCIFREATFNLDIQSDYLIIFSKPIDLWNRAVLKMLKKYPNKKIVNYNYPDIKGIVKRFQKEIIPTSGLNAILLLEELNLEDCEIRLFGFNGYSNGEKSVLRSNSSSAISNVHDYEIELAYFRKKFKVEYPAVFLKNFEYEKSLSL